MVVSEYSSGFCQTCRHAVKWLVYLKWVNANHIACYKLEVIYSSQISWLEPFKYIDHKRIFLSVLETQDPSYLQVRWGIGIEHAKHFK